MWALFMPVFDCPPDQSDEVMGSFDGRMFRGGTGGPPRIVWFSYHLLKVLLRLGPWPEPNTDDNANEQKPGKTVDCNKFVIDKLILEAIPSQIPCSSSEDRARAVDYDFRNETELADYLESQIRGLLWIGSDMFDYGCFLYEHIGEIEIRLSGKTISTFNLSEFPSRDVLEARLYTKTRKRYANWVVAACKIRLQRGLPIQNPDEHMRAFLHEEGVLDEFDELFDD